ncbi:hypothetical protein LCGC14_1985490, partial [marine sediment metagenome]
KLMNERRKLEDLRLHERMSYGTDRYIVYITKVIGGLIYTYEFYGDGVINSSHSSSVFVPDPKKETAKLFNQDFKG